MREEQEELYLIPYRQAAGSTAGTPSARSLARCADEQAVAEEFRLRSGQKMSAAGAGRRDIDFGRAGDWTGSAGRAGSGHRVFSLSLRREYPSGVRYGARGLPEWESAAQLCYAAVRSPRWESCRRSPSVLPGQRLGWQKMCIRNCGVKAALSTLILSPPGGGKTTLLRDLDPLFIKGSQTHPALRAGSGG